MSLKEELDATKLKYDPGNGMASKEFTMRNDVQILDEDDEGLIQYEEEEDPDEALFK